MNKGRLRVFILALTDFGIFYGILIAMAFLYQRFGGSYDMALYVKLWPFPLTMIVCNSFIRLYHGNAFYPGAALSVVEEIRRIFFSVSLTTLLLLSYLSITREMVYYSRLIILSTYFFAVLLIPVFRAIVRHLIKNVKSCRIDVLIAGAGVSGRELAEKLRCDWYMGLNPVGMLDDFITPEDLKDHPVPILGTLQDANETAKRLKVDYIILCLPLNVVKKRMNDLTLCFRHIMIVPDNSVGFSNCAYPCDLSGMAAVEVKNQLLLGGPRMLKMLLEILMASVTLLLLWPLFLVLALAVKFSSSGPIFYRATRLGLHGKTIKVLKFRTMYADADSRLEQMLAEDPKLEAEWREKFKLTNDPRITPIGNFLRKTSLDELPQFWNVLTGEMAVIGPRPIVEKEVPMYGENYSLIARVKPGITGLWQVSGRSKTSYDNRVFLDTYYIRNWSPWLDYYIFLKTIMEVFLCKGAQ